MTTSTGDIYKVLIVTEAVNNGITSVVVGYSDKGMAEECVIAVNHGHGTSVEGQVVRAVRLYA